jgi:DNA repair exonuclease SbcCD ATPase subunit
VHNRDAKIAALQSQIAGLAKLATQLQAVITPLEQLLVKGSSADKHHDSLDSLHELIAQLASSAASRRGTSSAQPSPRDGHAQAIPSSNGNSAAVSGNDQSKSVEAPGAKGENSHRALSNGNDTHSAELVSLRAAVQQLEEQLAEAQRIHKEHAAQASESLKSAQAEAQAAQASAAGSQTRADAAENRAEALNKTVQELEERIREAESNVQDASRSAESARAQLDTAEKELKQAVSRAEGAEESAREAAARAQQLEDQLRAAMSELEERERALATAQRKVCNCCHIVAKQCQRKDWSGCCAMSVVCPSY